MDQKLEYTYDAFVSYHDADKNWVYEWLLPKLKDSGVWVCDQRDFDIGVSRIINMERAVKNSLHTLLVLTPDWVKDEWTAFEALLTQTSDPVGQKRKLLPLLLKACTPPDRIAFLTCADFTQIETREDQLKRVVGAIRGELNLQDVGPELKQLSQALGGYFCVPYRPSLNFVGRDTELKQLHQDLMMGTISAQAVGLTGMGGIGKTQLAVEYAHRNKSFYSGGIFWLDGPNWVDEFARVAQELGLATIEHPADTQVRAIWKYLNSHPDALVILDNVDDPAALNIPILPGLVPAALICRLLITTRQRDFKNQFLSHEIKTLSEDAPMRLLLQHPKRKATLNINHPEHKWADIICKMLGNLPLALKLAGAYLGEYPEISLYDYRRRLLREGVIDTLDDTILRQVEMPTRHEAAVKATLHTSWEALTDKNARHVLCAAGQLGEAEVIPITRLSLLTGLSNEARPGYPAPLLRSLKILINASLIEEVTDENVRLHPLVREYAQQQTPSGEEVELFRTQLANHLLVALGGDPATLERQTAQRGVDVILGDLRIGLKLCPARAQSLASLQLLERILDREAHYLRAWNPATQPAYFMQQLYARAARLEAVGVQYGAKKQLIEHRTPYLQLYKRIGLEDPALLRNLIGHTLRVSSVVVTPDESWVVSASWDKTIKVWDLKTGQELRTLVGHTDIVYTVAVTPDGTQAVSGSEDKTLIVWDLVTGQALHTLEGHKSRVMMVAVTPDGKRAVSLSWDTGMKVWNLKTGQEICTLNEEGGGIATAIAVMLDGYTLISSFNNSLKVWNLSTGRLLHILEGHIRLVNGVALTPDGTKIVSTSDDKTLRVWDLKTRKTIHVLEGHEAGVTAVAVAPDGKRAISASKDATLILWDIETGEALRSFKEHESSILTVAMTPDGTRAVSGSEDRCLKVWDLLVGSTTLSGTKGHGAGVMAVTVTSGGKKAVSASWDHTLKVWDLERGHDICTLKGHTNRVGAVAITPDGKKVVSGSDDYTIRIWALETGRELALLRGHKGQVTVLNVMLDGKWVVSGSGDTTLKIWDLETRQVIYTFVEHNDLVAGAVISPDGKWIVSASWDKTLKVWDVGSVKEEILEYIWANRGRPWKQFETPLLRQAFHTLEGHTGKVNAVALTPDGMQVVSASQDRTLKVWSLDTGQVLRTLEGHKAPVMAVAVTPDGTRAVSASEDTTLKVWDLETGQEIISFGGGASFLSVAVTQHANQLWIIAGDQSGALWTLELIG